MLKQQWCCFSINQIHHDLFFFNLVVLFLIFKLIDQKLSTTNDLLEFLLRRGDCYCQEPSVDSVSPSEAISPPISVLSKLSSVELPDNGIAQNEDREGVAEPAETGEPSAEIEVHVDINWAKDYLNMSRRTLERYVEKGLITAIKYPSGQVYFLKSHLEARAELKKQSGLEYKDLVSIMNKSRLTDDIEPPQSTLR